MFGVFMGIFALTASIASGLLFYFSPHFSKLSVHAASDHLISAEITNTLTPSPSLTPTHVPDISPPLTPFSSKTPTTSLLPSFAPVLTSAPTIPSTPTPTPISLDTTNVESILTATPILTLTPTQTPTPTPKITLTPTQISLLPSPPLAPTNPTKGLQADLIFQLVNQHRTSLGLPAFTKDDKTCNIAQSRASQVYDELFVSGNIDGGLHPTSYPYYLTETIIYDDTETDAVNWWLSDASHKQILEGNYTYSCVACFGYSCAEIYTSYVTR